MGHGNGYVGRYKRLKLRNSQGKCYFGDLRGGESDEDDNRRMSRGSLLRERGLELFLFRRLQRPLCGVGGCGDEGFSGRLKA